MRIKKLAFNKNLTVSEVEKLAKIPENSIGKWLTQLPTVDRLQRVATVLGVSIYYLVNSYEQPEGELVISASDGLRQANPKEIKMLMEVKNDIKRENPKASYKELEENAGIPYGIAKTYMHRAKQKGELKELQDGSIEVVKEPPIEKSSYKKEIITEMIDIYMEDFRAVSPSERVDIGKRITMLLEKL